MLFYKIHGYIKNEDWNDQKASRSWRKENSRNLALKSIQFNEKRESHDSFVSEIQDGVIQMVILSNVKIDVQKEIRDFCEDLYLDVEDISIEEITIEAVRNMLARGERNDFVEDQKDILESYGLQSIIDCYGREMDFYEEILQIPEKEKIYEAAEKLLFNKALTLELNRIYKGATVLGTIGHPVHYMIQIDNEESKRATERILLQALYANDRIQSRRISKKSFTVWDGRRSLEGMEALYRTCEGGAIVIGFYGNNKEEDAQALWSKEITEGICTLIKNYQNSVLTILCLEHVCDREKELFYKNFENIAIVEIKEEAVYGEQAKAFLKISAQNQGIPLDETLFAELEEDKEYLPENLKYIFNQWYNKKLKTEIYPQYRNIHRTEVETIKQIPQEESYEELMNMVGLQEAKKVMQQALDFFKVQKLFREQGITTKQPTMHMVFTGNPGTAKTTTARLFARIMQKNNLLSKGHLIEVGRSDLIGRFVGWTAPMVKEKFREASGGVLFIDEAYSLVDDRDGCFGDEAINTIVQEMENHREDTVVIFAGYPDKMELFLKKNPGLRSRIAFHVPFPDYQTEELLEIADQFVGKYGMELKKEAREQMGKVLETVRTQEDFGNGRYVRNLVEKIRMTQASRLVKLNKDSLKTKDMITICAEDIPNVERKQERQHKIGFL